jgi:pimeloyl-ACP methyl ester carboxylesterase
LVHGMTYNSTLWSGLGFSDHYSWVNHATRRGYPTLAIDRLGHGDSPARPDPVSIIQFALETEIIHQLLSKLRASELGRSFSKIVYVGHSYGSLLGNSIARIYP